MYFYSICFYFKEFVLRKYDCEIICGQLALAGLLPRVELN